MRLFDLSLIAVLCLGFFAPALAADDAYPTTLDGEPIRAEMISLDDSARRLVRVGRIWLTLDDDSLVAFERDPDHEGVLLGVDRMGARRPVGVEIDREYLGDGERGVINPLATLTDEQIRALRGVVVGEWDKSVQASLGKIDPQRACVEVLWNAMESAGDKLPPIPDRLEHLMVEGGGQAFDVSAVFRQTRLRTLTISGLQQPLGVGQLADLERLESLRLESLEVFDLASLARAPSLRSLSMRGVRSASRPDLRGGFEGLWRLVMEYVQSPPVMLPDRHDELRTIRVVLTQIESLGLERAPRLERVILLSTGIDSDQAGTLRERLPGALVVAAWDALLLDSLTGADRVVVRSGGTCHRDPEKEEVLIELDGAERVRELLELIETDDRQSGGHCMCCGDPTFEIFREGVLVAELGFHHGQSLRWVGGWSGDGMLSVPSAQAMTEWMARHGHTGPRDDLREQLEQRAGAERRFILQGEAMGAEALEALRSAGSRDAAEAALIEAVGGRVEACTVAFRVLGATLSRWNTSDGFERYMRETFIDAFATVKQVAGANEALGTEVGDRGVARWLIYDGAIEDLGGRAGALLTTGVINAALTHPDTDTRRRSMWQLLKLAPERGAVALRGVVHGEFDPLKQSVLEPDGEAKTYYPQKDLPPETESDRAYAVLLLIGHTPEPGAELARELLRDQGLPEGDREILESTIGASP